MDNRTKVNPQVVLLIQSIYRFLPNEVIGEFLGLHRQTVSKNSKKIGLHKDMKLKDVGLYPWGFDERNFKSLTIEQIRMLQAVWIKNLVAESWKLYPKRYGKKDLSLAELILLYRSSLPEIVIARLLEIDGQVVDRRARQLGVRISRKQGLKLQDELYNQAAVPNLPKVSSEQMQAIETIYFGIRAESEQLRKDKTKNIRGQLLSKMRELKTAHVKSHPHEILRKCSLKFCKTSWPRGLNWFHKSSLSKDGFEQSCKYCRSCQASSRPKKRKYVPKKKLMSEAEQQKIINALKACGNKVPTLYLRQLFDLSQTQILRLRKLAGVKVPIKKSRSLLVLWRAKKPEQLDERFPSLSGAESESLLQIWKLDRAKYLREMSQQDLDLIEIMKEEKKKKLKSEAHFICRPCEGKYCLDLALNWPDDRWFFPKSTSLKMKRLCRHCQNRKRRVVK